MSLDISIFYFFYNFGQKINADWLIIFFADYVVFLSVIIFLIYLLKQNSLKDRIYYFNLFLLVEVLARGILTEAIRFFYARPRPFMVLPITNIITDNTHSFPSGHSVILFSLALVFFLMNKKWGWSFFGVAIIVGLSRVMGGVHWISDVVGGLVVAGLSFCLIYYLIFPKKKYFSNKNIPVAETTQIKNP